MKRLTLLLLILLGAPAVYAQTPTTAVQTLTIDLWPDYDQAALLVLLTGTLPPDTPLPATVSLPLPADATLNVVARITSDNTMVDDIDYTPIGDQVVFTTPDLRFRAEYYLPYSADGDQRSFTYTWLATLDVNSLELVVQQPASADNLRLEPTAVSTTVGPSDGLTYHSLAPQTVPAEQPFAVSINYTLNANQLTVNTLSSDTNIVDPITDSENITPFTNWPIVLAVAGGLILIVAVVWFVGVNRPPSRPRKPAPIRRQEQQKAAKFCHKCGQPAAFGDKFCRSCGTQLKA